MDYYETIMIEDVQIGEDELVDSRLAAKILGLSDRTVRDMGVLRRIPIYKIGPRTTRFLVSDLLDYRDSRKID